VKTERRLIINQALRVEEAISRDLRMERMDLRGLVGGAPGEEDGELGAVDDPVFEDDDGRETIIASTKAVRTYEGS